MIDCCLCSICKKSVINQCKGICCDHCNQWVHIKCNNLNDLDYNILKSKNENWYYILCTNKPTDALVNLMNRFNDFTDYEKENELNLPNC